MWAGPTYHSFQTLRKLQVNLRIVDKVSFWPCSLLAHSPNGSSFFKYTHVYWLRHKSPNWCEEEKWSLHLNFANILSPRSTNVNWLQIFIEWSRSNEVDMPTKGCIFSADFVLSGRLYNAFMKIRLWAGLNLSSLHNYNATNANAEVN